jgi:hypothetical protein
MLVYSDRKIYFKAEEFSDMLVNYHGKCQLSTLLSTSDIIRKILAKTIEIQ